MGDLKAFHKSTDSTKHKNMDDRKSLIAKLRQKREERAQRRHVQSQAQIGEAAQERPFALAATPVTPAIAPSSVGHVPSKGSDDVLEPSSPSVKNGVLTPSMNASLAAQAAIANVPAPEEYCTPRQPSPHTELPKFEEDDLDASSFAVSANDAVKNRLVTDSQDGKSSLKFRKQESKRASSTALNTRIPGQAHSAATFRTSQTPSKVKLFASSEDSRILETFENSISMRGRRPRSLSSEGIPHSMAKRVTFSKKSKDMDSRIGGGGKHLANKGYAVNGQHKHWGQSTNSGSLHLLSPERRAHIMRKRKRSPGGHLLVPASVSPGALKNMSNKTRVTGPKRGRSLMARIEEDDEHEKSGSFVRVVTPLRKRMRRSNLSAQDMTESQRAQQKNRSAVISFD